MFDFLIKLGRRIVAVPALFALIPVMTVYLTVCLSEKAAGIATPPDSGTVLNGVKQLEFQPPAESVFNEIGVTEPGQADSSGNPRKIRVSGFRLNGEILRPERELLKLISDQAGKELTLDDLNNLAGKISKYLRQQGYLVAFAYIPAQRIKDGIVEITIVPGKYGETGIINHARISTERLQKILSAIRPGAVITKKTLERVLLLLNDLSGIRAQATFESGKTAGTTDLIIEVNDELFVSGNVNADTWGSRYTGSERDGVQLSLNDFSHSGDELSLGRLSSGKGMGDTNIAYSALLGGNGLCFNMRYNIVNYNLGADFIDLGATGQAEVYSLELSYPIIRSRELNLYGQAGFDGKCLKDIINSASTYNFRTSSLWHLGLSGNARDTRWGGVNNFSLICYGGYLRIADRDAAETDAAGAESGGGFSKAVFTYNREQYLAPSLTLDFRFGGQLAGKNLDSSEKFSLGGADGVRAYPQGEGAGDEGCRATTEIKWRLPESAGNKEHFYLAGFCDYGYITVNKNPWDAAAVKSRGLSAIGLGLLYTWSNDFYLRCDYAWKLGHETATSDADQAGRIWVKVVKSF